MHTLLDEKIQTGEYYSDCKMSSVNEFSLDDKNVEKLWTISEKDLRIRFDVEM